MSNMFGKARFAPEAGTPEFDWSGIDIVEPKSASAPRWGRTGIAPIFGAVADALLQRAFAQ